MEDLGGANKDILKRQLQILRKPPEQRSPEDLKAFAASLSKTKFFQELGDYAPRKAFVEAVSLQ